MENTTVNSETLCIKVCADPGCEAVYHKVPIKKTKCLDCSGKLIRINEKTYQKKFSNSFFQYDYATGEYYRP